MIYTAPWWVRAVVLPFATCSVASFITWQLWPYIQPSASPLFFVAVMISALYGGVTAGLVATLLSAASTAYFFMTPQFSMSIDSSDIFRLIVFASVALLTSSIAAERNRTDEAQRRLVDELRAANARIRTLSDMLPMCPDCKRVRVGESKAEWKTVERYLAETPDLQVSHALCPDCSARHFPEFQARPG
jgi:K+-sensing histidine kinase KdpD